MLEVPGYRERSSEYIPPHSPEEIVNGAWRLPQSVLQCFLDQAEIQCPPLSGKTKRQRRYALVRTIYENFADTDDLHDWEVIAFASLRASLAAPDYEQWCLSYYAHHTRIDQLMAIHDVLGSYQNV